MTTAANLPPLREELTSDEFIAYKFFLIVFFPFVGLALNAGGFTDLAWYTIMGSGVAGYFYPDLWMNGLIADRQLQILRSMPFIVDLLALSTEAGLDFVGAISKVVEKASPSPLVDEGSPFALVLGLYVIAGLLMAVTVAAITAPLARRLFGRV